MLSCEDVRSCGGTRRHLNNSGDARGKDMNGRSRNGVACCLPSSRNEEVSACTPTEKRRGEERGRRRVRHRKEREKEKREKRGDPGRTGTALAESRERGVGTRGSGTRDWGPPGFEERRNIESTTQRGEPSRSIKSRSELYCTLSHTDFPPALTI